MNKKNMTGIGIVVVVLILGTLGYQNFLAPVDENPTPSTSGGLSSNLPELISAEGRVVPTEYVHLSFSSPGLVSEVLATEGDEIKAGETLARLGNYSQAQAQMTAAELQLITAQQAYDDLDDTLETQRALAEQAVARGRDAVNDAQIRLNNLVLPVAQDDIDEAYAQLVIAEDVLVKARDYYENFKNKPANNVSRAQAYTALQQAQDGYDRALRIYNYMTGTGSEIDIAVAESDLKVAEEQLAQAIKDLDALADGPDPDTLAVAEAQLTNAKAQLVAAEDALAKQELRAPFAGTVTQMTLKVGEAVTPGVPVASVADFSSWQIETTDLAENDIGLLSVGDTAVVTLDAFPGVEFEGTVVEIGLQGQDSRGQVTYPVTLAFEPGEYEVRWEMTAFVDVAISK